jgi:hypothetical protein
MINDDSESEKAAMATADEWYEAFARSSAFARHCTRQRGTGAD